MKKIVLFLFSIVALTNILCSCNDTETYAEKKEKEAKAISAYIAKNNVKVISEATFAAQNYTTNLANNEFVLFESNGIYLQIVREGCGEKLKSGENTDILCRFTEWNLMTDSLQLTNNVLYFSSIPEKMNVTNNSGTFSGSFDTSSSLMYSTYTSPSVPAGWLYPLTYLKIGRPVDEEDEIAKIRVIVPSAQGQYYASYNVYPCLYEITYRRGI